MLLAPPHLLQGSGSCAPACSLACTPQPNLCCAAEPKADSQAMARPPLRSCSALPSLTSACALSATALPCCLLAPLRASVTSQQACASQHAPTLPDPKTSDLCPSAQFLQAAVASEPHCSHSCLHCCAQPKKDRHETPMVPWSLKALTIPFPRQSALPPALRRCHVLAALEQRQCPEGFWPC